MLEVCNPYSGKCIEKIDFTATGEIDRWLTEGATLARNPAKRLPPHERKAILLHAAEIVRSRRETIAMAATEEGGKPIVDSLVEIDRAVSSLTLAAEGIANLTGEEIPMGLTASSVNRMAFTRREPIGLVLAYCAFNHPFNLAVHQVAPAIAVGAPVLLKPSPSTPLAAESLVKILREAGLPEEWCRVFHCANETAEKLVSDPRISYFSFIGAARIGWKLRSLLAPGTRFGLEHGGAAPVIVEADADLNDLVPRLAKGGFYHAGQACISVQRIFAHERIAGELGAKLADAATKLRVGDPVLKDTEVGPLIRSTEVARVDEWVKEAAVGGKILAGGRCLEHACYAPTLLLNPPATSRVSREEIFGPVMALYSYADRHEAIARANELPFAFQASVFTKNIDIALECAQKLEAAAVLINDQTAFRVDWMPFQGRKHSGFGVSGIPYTMKEYSEEKMILFRSSSL